MSRSRWGAMKGIGASTEIAHSLSSFPPRCCFHVQLSAQVSGTLSWKKSWNKAIVRNAILLIFAYETDFCSVNFQKHQWHLGINTPMFSYFTSACLQPFFRLSLSNVYAACFTS